MSETWTEYDIDKYNLVCATAPDGQRWFALPIPDSVSHARFLEMQEALRELAIRFGCQDVE